MEDREEFDVPRTSSIELRNFKRGSIWQDIERELLVWEKEGLSRLRDPQLDPETEQFKQDLGLVRYCQGGLDIIARLNNLIDAMIDIREAYEEDARNG